MDSLTRLLKYAHYNKHVQDSLDIIEKSILRYRLENSCISFNGGKDCTAIVHLVHSVAGTLCSNHNVPKITAFYAELPNRFDEESKFVAETVKRYNLKLLQYSNKSLKDSLCQLKSDRPNIEAIFIGTRIDDLKPGTHIDPFAPTDQDWPSFMRVNPILHWTYRQVWDFIRDLKIPYCDLYNQGYSSLGTKSDTVKNSSLKRYNDHGDAYYLPAWSLSRPQEERLSRSSSLDTSNKTD